VEKEQRLEDLLKLVEPLLGSCRVIADHTGPEWREATVAEVIDSADVRWFVKRHRGGERYRRELTAYQRWVLALGDRAPRLRAYDDTKWLLVLSAVPGAQPKHWSDLELLAQGGRVLRAFHDAEDLGVWEDLVGDKQAELDYWSRRGAGLIEPRVIDFVRRQLDNLRALPAPARVPCHGDFSPRNWLVADGELNLIDFGEAGPDVWVSDLGRLIFGWRLPSDGLAVFLEGYGCQPDSDELAMLRATYTAAVVRHIVWGHEHGNRDFEVSSRQLLDALISGELT
jgi:Ser/Thr protein kinase RdoA (MazF antagonist)